MVRIRAFPRSTGFRWGVVAVLLIAAVARAAVDDRSAVAQMATPAAPAPAVPEQFYAAPSQLPSEPGGLLRREPYSRAVPDGARAWRILYTTTRDDGTPTVASGIVLAAVDPPPGPRPIITWTHGTTGVVPRCAPSAMPASLAAGGFPEAALAEIVARGWVLVAPDYPGLGTAGPVPYMIGEGAARAALDAARAARQLPELGLDPALVVWGHSQGGHAALWTGIVAPRYAPELRLLGVAALAPPTDLVALATRLHDLVPGQSLLALLAVAYSQTYEEIAFDEIVLPDAAAATRAMAALCLAPDDLPALAAATEALPSGRVLASEPGAGALGERLRQNSVRAPIAAPVLVAQGESDVLVAAAETGAWVAERCAAGQQIEYRTYAGRDHMGLVAADSPLNADLIRWTEDRLSGEPPTPGCQTLAG